jgi:hypothetical protein
MKRIFILAIAVAALALPAFAQEDFNTGTVTVGAEQRYFNTNSSKFLEYRDIPQGGVLPFFSFQGKKGEFRYTLYGYDVTQKDQRYFGRFEGENWRLQGTYLGVPHNFGNGGKAILSPVSENEWLLSNTVQDAYQKAIVAVPPSPRGQIDYNCQARPGFVPLPGCFSLYGLVSPGLAAAPANVDLKLTRDRSNLAFDLTPGGGNFSLGLAYFHERRSGTRAANGTSFGFGNVVETPEPLRYITQDFGVNASLKGDWGVARAAVHFNDFKNSFDSFTFDNPFRATDSTDPSAYSAPSTSTRNGPVFGRTSLPPDNKATTETLGATLKLGARTRLSADVTLGQWKQNKDPLIPWTTNTAITAPDGQNATTAPLPASVLDGKIDTTAFNAFFHTNLTDAFGLNARYRRYDLDNKTPRYTMADGYVRFDAVWEDIGRITVPYGYTNDMFDAYANYGQGVLGLEVGWKYNKMKRTFRESDDTSENVFRVAADVHGGSFMLRGIGEFGSRDYSNYELATSEDASFVTPSPPANQTVLRRVDQAKRDLSRVGGQVEFAPGAGRFSLFGSYYYTQYKYNQDPVACQDVDEFPGQAQYCPGGVQTPLGMTHDKNNTFSVDANFAASDKVTLYAFYTYEDGDVLQNGRQSAATLNFSPNDVWTANITNKGNTFGAGADLTLVPAKWFLKVAGHYQKIEGNNNLALQPGFSTAIYGTDPRLKQCTTLSDGTPCAIPAFDDTTFTFVGGSLRYQFAKKWSAGAGVGYEDYKLSDAQTGNALNYMPASFFLQANNGSYHAYVGWLNLSYMFD